MITMEMVDDCNFVRQMCEIQQIALNRSLERPATVNKYKYKIDR